MKMQETSKGFVVEYCETHHNHDVRLSHLRVSNTVQASVEGKLAAGVPFTRVLDEIRETITTDGREHLMTRQCPQHSMGLQH